MIQANFKFIHLIFTLLVYTSARWVLASPASTNTQSVKPRVVALSPHITEILYDLGLESHILAVAAGSDYPVGARQLPSIKAHGHINLEAIVNLKPDWIIAWPYGQAKTLKQRLQPFGIGVLFSDPNNFEQLGQDYLSIAALFPNRPQIQVRAEWRVSWIQQQLAQLKKRYQNKHNKSPIPVFIHIHGTPPRTLNNQHPIVDLIEICGGYNVFGHTTSAAPLVSLEAVIKASPQLIILSNKGQQGSKSLHLWHERFEVPAVKHGHFLEIHPDFLHRPSVRTLEAAEPLCQAIANSRLKGHKG